MYRELIFNHEKEAKQCRNIPLGREIDGTIFRGTTYSDGIIEHPILPNAEKGRLIVGESQEEKHQLNLGHLDPLNEISGVQARLKNLNIYFGEVNGELDNNTVLAIREFQKKHALEETGEIDEEIRNRLEEVHGS